MADLGESGLKEPGYCGGHQPISMEKMTLLTLWYLANQESMRGIADRFDVAKSSVHIVVHKLTHHVAHKLAQKYINWPTPHLMPSVTSDFKSRANFPGVLGALDGSHIPIEAPSAHQLEYNNRKMTHSVILQAVCDNSKKFTNCFAGYPGSAHDSRVLHSSQLFIQAEADKHKLFPSDAYHLVADTAYPLHSWLITPFKDTGSLTPQQTRYNTKLCQTRVVIECAFGLLKGRFRRLKMVVCKVESIPDIIITCCVLHNMCLMNDSDELLEIQDMDVGMNGSGRVCGFESSQGKIKRNYLVASM
ncbi:putative nuclease HARBI1 [Patiria miniata]|uniref:DDE Tnp4 domain-containing protein n=1 Tax=Patiria miniata TaxID=46514 RepID=A0A914BCA8_PATMI|nr:putative nuclease HARBI1 [Patiria miniata]